MFSIILTSLLVSLAVIGFFVIRKNNLLRAVAVASGFGFAAVVTLGVSLLTTISSSHIGVVTTFGKIHDQTLTEGLHLMSPFDRVSEIFTGVEVAQATDASAASKDLQSVHATLNVNYHPDIAKVRELYALNPALTYKESFVTPATFEVFKAVVARYTAEELVTKRSQVSEEITLALNAKLNQYYIRATNVNLVNFGFSKAFDAAIEEKVTASQKAATAQNNLARVEFEAKSRIAEAKGEAEAIRIQAESVSKAGGEEYVKLKAVEKWNGVLPTYMTSGASTPFVGVK